MLQKCRPAGAEYHLFTAHFIHDSKGVFISERTSCCEKHIHFSKIDTMLNLNLHPTVHLKTAVLRGKRAKYKKNEKSVNEKSVGYKDTFLGKKRAKCEKIPKSEVLSQN